MDWMLLHNVATVIAFLAFLGIVWWAYAPSRKSKLDEVALLPFDGEER